MRPPSAARRLPRVWCKPWVYSACKPGVYMVRQSACDELHFVSCELHEGVLTLRGRVSSFYLKQVAQTLVRALGGVGKINNRLEVAAPSDSP